jgi:rubrerythrin
MFFFIGGIQPKTVTMDRQPRNCPACGHLKVYLKRIDRYLSIFFIPLFPVKRGTPFLICENCSSTFDEQGRGVEFERMPRERKCPHCGRTTIDPEFSFCPYCGNPF